MRKEKVTSRGQTEAPPIKRTRLLRGTSPLIFHWADIAQIRMPSLAIIQEDTHSSGNPGTQYLVL
jgi:hypothetical protein